MEKIHASKLLAGLVPAGFLTSDPEVELVTTDSREVRPGCIFVAFPGERFDFMAHPQLTFAGVDRAKYPALEIACECLRRRGTAACTMNGANEVAVAAFLGRKCAWLDIVRAIEYALGRASFAAAPTLGDYAEANDEARRLAAEYLAL